MFERRARGIRGLFLLCQMAGISALFWLWLPLTQTDFLAADLHLETYALYNATLLLGIAVGHLTEREKRAFRRPDFRSATNNALWKLIFSVGCLFVYLVGVQDHTICRFFVFTLVPLLYGVLVLSERYLPAHLVRASFSGPHEQRVALVGPIDKTPTLRDWLASRADIGCQAVGVICDGPGIAVVPGLKVLGALEDLERAIRHWKITQVILLEFPQCNQVLHYCTEVCEKLGVRLLVHCDFEERFRHPVTMFEDGGLRFIGLRQEPLDDPLNRFCKRALDLCISIPVVLLVLPLVTLVVWGLQRWQSPGPIFFRQLRSGIQNQPFIIYKFRTMHVKNDDETRQVKRDDPRVFPAGCWMRRLSVDELPQFYNVLRGEMSVVGPRPHLPRHDERFARAMNSYHVREAVKPGITGLAQVRGFRGGTQNDSDIANRVNADLQYVETWTLELDCSIVLRTLWQMLFPPRTAY